MTYKGKHWFSNLALEAEAAITVLHTHEQEHIRRQVTTTYRNYTNNTTGNM